MKYLVVSFLVVMTFWSNKLASQSHYAETVFSNQPINFEGIPGNDATVKRLQKGRLIYKKIVVPEFLRGSDVMLKLALKSAGDRWD